MINIETEDAMKMGQLIDVLINRAHKQGIAPEAFDVSKEPFQSGKLVKKEVQVRNGLKQEDAKKIDDLQEVIQASKGWGLGIPLQYENMRS